METPGYTYMEAGMAWTQRESNASASAEEDRILAAEVIFFGDNYLKIEN